MTEWLGWYFADRTECLRYGDGRKIVVGETHKVDCEPILCKQGLHASPTVYKALAHAGPILFRVRLSGTIVHGDDKSAATERTYLARLDARDVLRAFALRCALEVIHLWDCPSIVREYLKTGDESKRAAAQAAAAMAAVRNAAAQAAARSAWDAAQSAAWTAAWSTTWDATWAAAQSAARNSEWDEAISTAAQERILEEMVHAAIASKEP